MMIVAATTSVYVQEPLTTMTSRSSSRTSPEEESMRAALQVAVAQICTQECENDGTFLCKSVIQTLTELTFLYATTSLSNDLVAFSQHAKRQTITPDDVHLVARKNPDNLLSKLHDFSETADFGQSTTTTSTTTESTAIINTRKKAVKLKETQQSTHEKSSRSPSDDRSRKFRARLLDPLDTDLEGSAAESGDQPVCDEPRFYQPDSDSSMEAIKENMRPPAKRNFGSFADFTDEDEDGLEHPSMQKRKKYTSDASKPVQKFSDDDSVDF